MAFLVGLVLLGAALWWLFRLKQRDLRECREVLGLAPASGAPVERGTTPEGFAYVQRAELRGTLLGRPATLAQRDVRYPRGSQYRRRGSAFTVLELALDRPARASLRIQPAGVLGVVEALVRGEPTDRVAIDPDFDAAYLVYSDAPTAVLTVLTPAMRERLMAFRAQTAPGLATSTAAKLASGFVLGTFHVDGATARYLAFGTPAKATAEHVKAAAPVLLELAVAAGA